MSEYEKARDAAADRVRKFIVVQRPNGLGRSVMPYGVTYSQNPDYEYIIVVENSAYLAVCDERDKLKAERDRMDDAIYRLKSVLPSWSGWSSEERRKELQEIAEALAERSNE